MKKKLAIILITAILLAVGTFVVVKSFSGTSDVDYQFATITRGDLESTISATGTLSPLTTVDVGTQVSGIIDKVFVDYNDKVKSGQLLAVLDTTLLKSSVTDAEANYDKAEAQMEKAEYDYDLNKELFGRGLISEAEFLPYSISVKTQNAALKSAEAALQRARQNLDYAMIRSPITGTVIEKSVEEGQTVAASFSTPTLFLIAQDLSSMEILVDVDESDIGSIEVDQKVRFEVQAYPDMTFDGTVRQVRMQPQTISNVVTYTVVVDAVNKDDLLMPGMTATVDFITEQKSDVLLIPNKALRFSPSEEEMTAFFERRKSEFEQNNPNGFPPPGDSSGTSAGGQMRPRQGGTPPTDMATVWYIDNNGQLAMEPFRKGMSDGTNTEILASRDLTEGMKIINGTSDNSSSSGTSSRNNGRPGFGPPPGF